MVTYLKGEIRMPQPTPIAESETPVFDPFRTWPGWKAFLLPGDAEQDPGFRRQIDRLGLRGLYIIAGVTAGMPILGYVFHTLADLIEPRYAGHPKLLVLGGLLAFAGMIFAAARTQWVRARGRLAGFLAGFVVSLILTWSSFALGPDPSEAVLASMFDVIVVLLVGVAALPARPMQMAVWGAAIAGANFFSMYAAESMGLVERISLHYYAGMDLVLVLCVALTGFNYQLLLKSYLAHRNQMQSQSQLLVSESAVSISRFAATLSHELNSPLGALSSALETLEIIEMRREQGGDLKRAGIERELIVNARRALGTLGQVVGRMQRFTNLDRAETSSVSLEQMLRDVAAMAANGLSGDTRIELAIGALPSLTLKPQQISSVFSHVLHNAVEASNGAAKIDVSAQRLNGAVEIVFRDYGKGLTPDEVAGVFQPEIRARGSRMGAANWGMFTARQVVREHGGEIEIDSTPGQGTAVTVKLPVARLSAEP